MATPLAIQGAGTIPATSDARLSTISGVYFTVITSMSTFMMPVAIDAMTAQFTMTPWQIGYLSLAIFGVSTLANCVCAPLTGCIPWSGASVLASLLLVAGNLVAAFSANFPVVLAGCTMASLGCGVISSVGCSAIAVSNNPQKTFGIAYMIVAIFAIAWLISAPFAIAKLGWSIVFIGYALVAVPGLYVSLWLRRPPVRMSEQGPSQGSRLSQWRASGLLSLMNLCGQTGVLFIFSSLTLLSTYTIRLATGVGLSSAFASFTLSGSYVFCCFGSMASVYLRRLGNRWGTSVGLVFVIAGLLVFMRLKPGAEAQGTFVAALVVFMFGWNFSQTFILATTAAFDASGTSAAMAMGVSGVGSAAAPFLMAPIIDRFGVGSVPPTAILLLCAGAAALLPFAQVGIAREVSY